MLITNASTRFATFGILDFFGFNVLSGKFRLNLHGRKRVMQALGIESSFEVFDLSKIKSSFYPECDLEDKSNYKRMYYIKRDGTAVEKVVLDVIDPFHREILIFKHYLRHFVKHFCNNDLGINLISRDEPWDFKIETSDNSKFNIEITSIA
ncbi:hypothetical protein CAG70_05335 [Photobacterium halotolerans]|uniref:hypothetical protein n=1 Tax=Photobacterium halotolerans TaxID=265726 RepID=UPI001428DDCF|nr:hypothetical protein [Photobacterium halotolerans]NAX46420.1 hypothetical protein [Photobacterium halotolerans]